MALPSFLKRGWVWILLLAALLAVGLQLPDWLWGPKAPMYAVSSGPMLKNVVATGRVMTTARYEIASEIVGTVVERLVSDGEPVAAGQLVVKLDPREAQARVAQARAALNQLVREQRPVALAALREAQARYSQTAREAQRLGDLRKRGLVAQQAAEQATEAHAIASAQSERARLAAAALAPAGSAEQLALAQLDLAQASLAKTEIRAGADGLVLERLVEVGDVVQAGRALLLVARSGGIEIVAQVDEKNLQWLQVGQAAEVSPDAFPDARFAATLGFIAPRINPTTATVELRLQVLDPAPELRQDMTVSIDVEVERLAQALSVPNDALRQMQAPRAQVLQLRAGRLIATEVVMGMRGVDRSEIRLGLKAGDLVLPGDSKLRAGMRARAQSSAQAD